ncbi:hypothetical protein [Nocardia sp. NPDC050406]|uniref:hypothetical protein n=1 Tax=Nocardia sp. NPDC050406 TaxID=3364318 RepID=UPI0037A6A48B
MNVEAGGVRTFECDVDPTWIDINDHMNAQYYGIVVYRAHATFTDLLGLGDDYVRSTKFGKVDVLTRLSQFAAEQSKAGYPEGVGRTIRVPRS